MTVYHPLLLHLPWLFFFSLSPGWSGSYLKISVALSSEAVLWATHAFGIGRTPDGAARRAEPSALSTLATRAPLPSLNLILCIQHEGARLQFPCGQVWAERESRQMEQKASPAAAEKKGKGRARSSDDDVDVGVSEPSVASRVAASAAALAKDFARGTTTDASAIIASGSGLAGKGQATSVASSSSWAGSASGSAAEEARGTLSESRSGAGLNEGFRSAASHDPTIAVEFDEFLSRGVDRLGDYSPTWSEEFRLPSRSGEDAYLRGPLPSPEPEVEPVYDDGAEVRMLLSDPNLNINTPPDLEAHDLAEPTADDLFGTNFSIEEQEAANKIKSSLPAVPTYQPISATHPLNLQPENILKSDQHPAYDTLHIATPTAEQREALLSDWEGVLCGYTDEVWGETLPAVREAQKEIEEVRAGTRSLDSKAVARLKQILGHVQNSTALQTAVEQKHVHLVQRPAPARQREEENPNKREVPTFHCPWISCHEVWNSF